MITFSKDKLLRHLERRPMLKALVPFVVGILLADGYALPVWGVAIGFVVGLLLNFFLSNILKLKPQATGVSHTGTDSCYLWGEEQYGYALGKKYKS